MFRRKDETANDPSNPSAAPSAPSGAPHTESAASSAPSSHSPQAPSGASAQPPAAGTYAPSSSNNSTNASAPRPAGEAPRSQAPSTSYRPTPIAEFNRGASRMPEAMRASAPTASGTSSFGGSPDKSAASGKSNRRVLTVGNDILLKGEIATCDRLVIEGRVEAKLSEVHTVEIAECGSFKGTAEVEDAEISGVFEGDLIVRNRLVIYTSGEVRGNISYGEIEIERGGRLTGQIKTGSGAKGAAAAKPYDTQDKRKETAAA